MFEAFKKAYEVKGEELLFHGTSAQSAEMIIKSGFRAAACKRNKFGEGLYTTGKFNIAAQFAEPEPDFKQTIVMAKVLMGPVTLGREGILDFGMDAQTGKEVLTTTNEEGTIFCSKFEDAVLAKYVLEIQHRLEPQTEMHKKTFPYVHPGIWTKIKPPPNPAAVLPVQVQAGPEFKDEHDGLQKGDFMELRMEITTKKYKQIKEKITGTIVCFSRNPKGPWHLHLAPSCNDMKQKVHIANLQSGDSLFSRQNTDHVRALVGHFEKIPHGATTGEKRKSPG